MAAASWGTGCVGEVHSPGTMDCRTLRSSMGQTGSPVARSNTYRNAVLLGCITASMRQPSTVMSPSMGGPTVSYSQTS